MKILIAVISLLFSLPSMFAQQPGATADTSVFGVLKLGEPLALPECSQLSSGEYIGIDTKACYKDELLILAFSDDDMAKISKGLVDERMHEPHPIREGEIVVSFPEKPRLVSGELRAQILGGKVEFIKFDTAGLADQDQVLAALKEKYGEPVRSETVAVKNSLGAEFSADRARWAFENITVSFDAALGRVDRGLVMIGTEKGMAFELDLAKHSGGPKL